MDQSLFYHEKVSALPTGKKNRNLTIWQNIMSPPVYNMADKASVTCQPLFNKLLDTNESPWSP